MPIFDWLRKSNRFTFYEDHYALTRSSLWASLHQPILDCISNRDLVLLIAHFPDKFSELIQQLETWKLDFEVVTNKIDDHWLTEKNSSTAPSVVYVSLAEMIAPPMSSRELDESKMPISLIMVERHPVFERDTNIENFARRVSTKTKLGYFISLDDAIVKNLISSEMVQLMKQMGLSDHDLITSNMLTRRIKKVLSRHQHMENELPADSAEEWFQINNPET